MQTWTEKKVLGKIQKGESFDSVLVEGAFEIKVTDYVPYVCTAIHAGGALRPELDEICLLSEKARLVEEDPGTDLFIRSLPITLIGRDSRYEYDLNRDPENALYDIAWGEKVWPRKLSEKEREQSLKKHALYYRVLDALLAKLSERFDSLLLFDVHSYNHQIRSYQSAPIFNIGTFPINMKRWGKIIDALQKSLKHIELPNLATTAERDVVFQGKGYQTAHIRDHFPNVLAIPLEIKKVYMDEETGELFPLVVEALEMGLYQTIVSTSSLFTKGKVARGDLIPSEIERTVLEVDRALFKLAKGIETLSYVNPTNLRQQKKLFFSKKRYEPQFHYKQLRINPYHFREQLYALPVSNIEDPLLRDLYSSVIDNFAKKIDLLTSIGTEQFLYNSLRQYGEPSTKDIANARFLLHCSADEPIEESCYSAEEAKKIFEQLLEENQIKFKVLLSNKIVAKAMVENSKSTLHINREAAFTETELRALINHEFGIHVLTTVNARKGPLHIFSLGLPGHTHTQEGLAILSEYLSGCLTLKRLKILALRVLAINMMIKGMRFHALHSRLVEEYGQTPDDAFDLAVRVFRGGGFTKDYLYLSGFSELLRLWKKRKLTSLMIGKTSLRFLDTLDHLIERGTLPKPFHIPDSIAHPTPSSPILDFIVDSIH